MHLHLDRGLATIVLTLLAGGWVCQSNAENRCPGALTCAIDVANVCCPFGSHAWCNGCAGSASSCPGDSYTCDDESRVLECSFSAKIAEAQCVDPVRDQGSVTWTLQVTGTMNGCGQETVLFGISDNDTPEHVDCGSWTGGVYGGCIPPGDDVSTATWTIERPLMTSIGQSQTLTIDVSRAHGANPILAMTTIVCGP